MRAPKKPKPLKPRDWSGPPDRTCTALFIFCAACILLGAAVGGCMAPYVWEPPVPPQPTPTPTPEPTNGLSRASFDAVTVGAQADVLNDLPPADASVNVGGRQILSWDLNEARPTGGYVQWEVHIEGGEIVASHAW